MNIETTPDQKNSHELADPNEEQRLELARDVGEYAEKIDRQADILADEALHEIPEGETGTKEKIEQLKRSFKEQLQQYLRIVVFSGAATIFFPQGGAEPESRHEIIERAKITMEQEGITPEQQATYTPGINDVIYRGVTPRAYFATEKIKQFVPNLFKERMQDSPMREDAWRLYLGIPQTHNTFGISEYTPDSSNTQVYSYKINGWFDRFMSGQPFKTTAEFIRDLSEKGGKQIEIDGTSEGDLMGHFTLGIGHDEKGSFLYYYDLWDLDIPIEQELGLLGKPLVIYDRLYFNPNTFEPLEELHLEKGKTSETM